MTCKCKQPVTVSKDGPKAIGPYSLGIISHDLIFTSGQAGLSPQTGELVSGGIEAETRQTIENLAAILKAAGSSLEKVIKTTVYLKSMTDFAAMNAVYAEYFGEESPARTTIQAAALPKNAMVEIDAIAIKCSGECDCGDDKDECGCGCGCEG
jgi:2-iminobutanoate/2-iminopropanoate deaminase